MITRSLFVALILASMMSVGDLAAAESASPTPSAAAPSAADGGYPVAVGDHWTLEERDEISGEVKEVRNFVVTDTSKNEIAVRFDVPRTGRSGSQFFDTSWNLLHGDEWRFTPNDGFGIKLPLAVGAKWKFSSNNTNASAGAIWKRTGTSSVVAEEQVTTAFGVFATFVIETKFVGRNTKNPMLVNEGTMRTWYSPDLGHWIKRTNVLRRAGHVVGNATFQLTAFAHKQ